MRIGIIGAGIMGLSLGYRLSKYGHQVHILERAPQIGGLSTWCDYGDFIWDKYYHVILRSDANLLALIEELGLTDQLFWKPTKTGFLWKGKHVSMSSHWEFLTFPVLSLLQKIRLGAGILYGHYAVDPASLETTTAQDWLISVFGKKVFLAIWEPLLTSKYGVLKERVPATVILSVINRYFSTRSKTDGQEWMGHLKDVGMKLFCETLAQNICDNNGTIECGINVEGLENTHSDGVTIRCESKTYTFDRVISTLPIKLLKGLGPNLQGIFADIPDPQFLGVIRLALVLKKSLSPFYVTNLIDKGFPFTGIIEASALTDGHEMSGHKLVMIPRYDVPDSPWFDKSEEEIREIFLENLKSIWPDIESNITYSCVHRDRIVQALWIDHPPAYDRPPTTTDQRVWSVNAELAGRDTLNNNALVGVATQAVCSFQQTVGGG